MRFFGLFDEPSGLATAARNYRKAVELAGCTVTSILVTPTEKFKTNPDVRRHHVQGGLAGGVNIFALNADMTHRFFMDGRLHLLDDCYNIGIWFWELAEFPDVYVDAFGAFDEIWVASRFCHQAIAAKSPLPVRTMPMLIEPDCSKSVLTREYFGLPSDVFIFACVFDIGSVMERKNPIAAIQAFKAAFGQERDVCLVLKYHGGHHYPHAELTLLEAVGASQNIIRLNEVFDEEENKDFRNEIDAFVSPHRSEGFGLNIAEFMAIKKPVVATAYGGCQDFLNEETGYVIPFSLQRIGRQVGPYLEGSLWAEPDVDALARILKTVHTSKDDRDRRASSGKAIIERKFGAAHVAAAMHECFRDLRVHHGLAGC